MKNELEALKLENARLVKQNDLLGGWISLISHDTKQLFGNLKWLIEASLDNSISQEAFFSMLPQIQKDAIKNYNTATDTSEWLKTQYGNFSPNRDILNSFSLFEEIKEEFSARLEEKNLLFEFVGDESQSIITDKILLRFILNKTVDNAIKYSHNGERIIFSVGVKEDQHIITITDSGTGIKENNLETIYSFENAIYEGTNGEIGVGLSLKIVQSFVFLIGGNLKIESLEDHGTTISICLPQIEK